MHVIYISGDEFKLSDKQFETLINLEKLFSPEAIQESIIYDLDVDADNQKILDRKNFSKLKRACRAYESERPWLTAL